MDKKPMQADGGDHKQSGRAEDTASRPGGTGESQGGAYPNPHTGKGGKKSGPGDILGHGGQSEIAYEGGPNPNATAQED